MGGMSGMESRCRNHPTQKQPHGVCASCLREKLARLSASNRQISTLPCSSNSSVSSPASEEEDDDFSLSSRRLHGGRQRNGSRRVAFVVDVNGGTGGLMRKSRSIAFVPRGGLAAEMKNAEKKKKGFWSKLIPAKESKEAVMMRKSKTLRERLEEYN